jgi:hypothetical protein
VWEETAISDDHTYKRGEEDHCDSALCRTQLIPYSEEAINLIFHGREQKMLSSEPYIH